MATWRRQDAQLVQKHFLALFHPKPWRVVLMCTYAVVTHPCDIPPLAQARPMMLCIYTSNSSEYIDEDCVQRQ